MRAILIAVAFTLAGLSVADAHEPRRHPGDVFRDCDDCPEMVVIPAGSFDIGPVEDDSSSPEPTRHVTIEQPFAVGRFEITRAQYASFSRITHRDETESCGTEGVTWRAPGFEQGDDHPVVCVSYGDIEDYLSWLNRRAHGGYRLMTVEEWEYAAQRGAAYSWGPVASHEFANYGADQCCGGLASGRDQWVNTSPVGSFAPNAFGLYDMEGNVWEWIRTCRLEISVEGNLDCQQRRFRGGSWYDMAGRLRSNVSAVGGVQARSNVIGFRVAKGPLPNPCVRAEETWATLRTSTDRDDLINFLRDVNGQCRVRDDVYRRLASLVQSLCAGAEETWSTLRNSTDPEELRRFLRNTYAECERVRERANRRLERLEQ